MKNSTSTIAVGALIAAISSSAVAGISSFSAGFQPIAAPPSVVPGALESNTHIRVFNERLSYALPVAIAADLTLPGTWFGARTPGVIAAGTVVYSWYFHLDPIPGAGASFPLDTIKFDQDILGIIVDDVLLDASDGPVGNPGTVYPTGAVTRGLETFDFLQLLPDQRTIVVDIGEFQLLDNVRVLTRVPAPGVGMVLGVAALAGTRRRR